MELPPGAEVHFNINIEVWGPDSDVSGFGWGALADPDDLTSRHGSTPRNASSASAV